MPNLELVGIYRENGKWKLQGLQGLDSGYIGIMMMMMMMVRCLD